MENLTHLELHRLIGKPTPELEAQVDRVISDTLIILSSKLGGKELAMPEVLYDLKGRTAGWAQTKTVSEPPFDTTRKIHTIRLNIDLLYRNTESMLQQTVPHEVCHIVQHQLYTHSKAHGYEWQSLMRLLGLTPDRCHQYDVELQRKHDRPYKYVCPCGNTFNLTRGMHSKIKMGSKRICNKCKGYLVEVTDG